MKIAHLILAHKNPQQLERMLQAMEHPAFDFYIHLDKKSDISSFRYLSERRGVYFIQNRVDVHWGGYSLVQATINGMKEIGQTGNFDYLNLMSGQDFPIKSPAFIHRFFSDNKGKEFINSDPYNKADPWWNEASTRFMRYNLHNLRIPGKFRIEQILNRLLPERKPPLGYTIAGRSQWFSISQACVTYLLAFLDAHPKVVRYFKYVWGADEFIFSTLLFNSPFHNKIAGSDNLLYTDWSGESKLHPRVLTAGDLGRLQDSSKLFARKVDLDTFPELIHLLEEWLSTAPVA